LVKKINVLETARFLFSMALATEKPIIATRYGTYFGHRESLHPWNGCASNLEAKHQGWSN
jgi:hypothetical protein